MTNATGTATVTINSARTQISVSVSSTGLSGITGAHIHFGSVGASGPIMFDLAPAGQGTFSRLLTQTDFIPVTGVSTFTAALTALLNGDAYINFPTTARSRGEIRGQILPVGTAYLLSLTLAPAAVLENAGALATTLTLTRNTSKASVVTVALMTDQPNRIRLPRSVTFGAGASSASVVVGTVDDAIVGGSVTATIAAAISGFVAQTRISISDNEQPQLSLSLSASTLAENSATPIIARIRRNTPLTAALSVTLTSSDTSETGVPTTVTIPANAAFVEFPITARDDAFADGAQRVIITARATGFALPATATLTVTDNEVPTLTLTLSPSRITEGGAAATATLRRNSEITALTPSLAVSLTASVPGQVTVPTRVTIPARAAQITFPVAALNDIIADGPRLVTLTARASNFAVSNAQVIVADNEAASNGTLAGRLLLPSSLQALPIPGVTLTLRQGTVVLDITTSAANGTYVFRGLPRGSFTITPAKPAYTFTPTSRLVVLPTTTSTSTGSAMMTVTNLNFSGTPRTQISGTLTRRESSGISTPVANAVVVARSSTAILRATTDARGRFLFDRAPLGSYSLAPTLL
ncbi:MAG TPA: CHRD domain-containing protein, partial [Chloroflexota bacterium]|nr:CHRD domain-containing protein [Chloroflexota bacterium]